MIGLMLVIGGLAAPSAPAVKLQQDKRVHCRIVQKKELKVCSATHKAAMAKAKLMGANGGQANLEKAANKANRACTGKATRKARNCARDLTKDGRLHKALPPSRVPR